MGGLEGGRGLVIIPAIEIAAGISLPKAQRAPQTGTPANGQEHQCGEAGQARGACDQPLSSVRCNTISDFKAILR